jgi:DNA adenine methylase
VYRTNLAGRFNVPMGVRTGALPAESLFYRCSLALRNAEIVTADFEDVISLIAPGEFAYLDPPYGTERYRGEYGYGGFGSEDIPRLVRCLHLIESRGAFFLLSYGGGSIDGLPARWRSEAITVRRHVASFAKHRATVPEILVSNLPLLGES